MAETTGIAWADSTFNPWIGCTRVSPGCDHCYAAVSRPALAMKIEWGAGKPRHRTAVSTWKAPLKWDRDAQASGKRHLVFCSSLADVFDNEVPDAWRGDLWDLIEQTPHLTWLLLTKRIGNAARMLRTGDWAASPRWNVWIGASVVNQEEADRDIPKLLATPASKRFVSYEPALGPVDWSKFLFQFDGHVQPSGFLRLKLRARDKRVDWIIVGGESDQPGHKARPFNIEWARQTVKQCKGAGVAPFVKQLGSSPWFGTTRDREPHIIMVDCKDRAGADPSEWPVDLRVQEFPS